MRYTVRYSPRFKKAFKKCLKRGCDGALFQKVLQELGESGTLSPRYLRHRLSGKYAGLLECHITPDWLLIWKQDDNVLTLILVDTGTHSDLF